METTTKKITIGNREVARFKAHLFGHYDSRGGAFLIRDAENEAAAKYWYGHDVFMMDSDEAARDLANEDFIGAVEVIVADADDIDLDTEGADLLYDNENIHDLFIPSLGVVILYRGEDDDDSPAVLVDGVPYQLNEDQDDRDVLGEDAIGLVIVHAK